MPDLSAYQIPPPRDWQVFERICRSLWAAIWNQPNTLLNGRTGQRQHGVDVYGKRPGAKGWSGVQCKGKDGRFGEQVSIAELHREVDAARQFRPALQEWILATTTKADTAVQEAARQLTDEHQAQGLFSVTVVDWDDILLQLTAHRHVAQMHGLLGLNAAPAQWDESWLRDYLLAVRAHCCQLPFLAGIFPDSLIEDLFVDLPVSVRDCGADGHGRNFQQRTSKFLEHVLDTVAAAGGVAANYACFGSPGIGKTLLCMRLTALHCERALANLEKGAGVGHVVPAYVRASDLANGHGSFEKRIHAAIERELGSALKSPIDPALWSDRSTAPERCWLVVIDGIDEVTDPERRLRLMHSIRSTYLSAPQTFRFFISCRDTAMAEQALGGDFRIARLDDLSFSDAHKLYLKYSQRLARASADSVAPVPAADLQTMLRTPLLIAIAATVHRDNAAAGIRLIDLFEDFIRTLLFKRGFSEEHSRSLRVLLTDLAERGDSVAVDKTTVERARELKLVPANLPGALAKQALIDRLVASGLIVGRGDSVRFVHASFRLLFRAELFATRHPPGTVTWELLDPYKNGWDFTQFVLERWQAQGVDLTQLYPKLLSHQRQGLRLLSRLAGCGADVPESVVKTAILKWRSHLQDSGPGHGEGVLEYLHLMARLYPSAERELARIALDSWEYFEAAAEAARYLVSLGRKDEAYRALLKILRGQDPSLLVEAAQVLCEMGRLEEGVVHLKRLAADAEADEGLLAFLRAIEALHRYGQTTFALDRLENFMRDVDVNGMSVGWVMETCVAVAGEAAALDFLQRWLAARPDLPRATEIVAIAKKDVLDPRLEDLLDDKNYRVEREAGFQRYYQRVTCSNDAARLVEMMRNLYLDAGVRRQALARLEHLNHDSYCQNALWVLARQGMSWYERKALIETLRRVGLDAEVVAAVKCGMSAGDEVDAHDAQLLIWAGDRAAGIELLQRIAVQQGKSIAQRAKAVCALADFGASDTALQIFMALLAEHACAPRAFEDMAKVLLGTDRREEVIQAAWRVLLDRAQPIPVRLKAASLPHIQDLPEADQRIVARFLRTVARRQTGVFSERFAAVKQWYDFEPDDAFDYCIDLTRDTDATVEERLEVAGCLQRWMQDHFTTHDAYDQVVGDRKLTLPERLRALLHVLENVWVSDADEDDEYDDVASLLQGVTRELTLIAKNREIPATMRFKALGMEAWDERRVVRSSQHDDDDWPSASVIRSFLRDKSISLHMKQRCVLDLSQCKPALARKHCRLLERNLQDSNMALACVQQLDAFGMRDSALAQAKKLADNRRVCLSNRFKAVQLIYGMGAQALAIQWARRLRLAANGKLRIAQWAAAELAEWLFQQDLNAEGLELCEQALAATSGDLEGWGTIIRTMARAGFSSQSRVATEALSQNFLADPGSRDEENIYQVAGVLADLGQETRACDLFKTLAASQRVQLHWRLRCCRRLAAIGQLNVVTELLESVSGQASLRPLERIDIAQCYADLGAEDRARVLARELVTQPRLTAYGRDKLGKLCSQLGLATPKSKSRRTTRFRRSALGRIEALVDAGKWQRAEVEIRHQLNDSEIDALGMIELLQDLEDTPLDDLAREALVRMAATTEACDRVRAAEALQALDEHDRARELLIAMAADESLSPEDRLWLAQALRETGCDELAYEQMSLAAQSQSLEEQDLEFLTLLRSHYVED